MGRPAEAGSPRSRKVTFRVSEDEAQRMEQAQKDAGHRHVSDYVREVVRTDYEQRGIR